MNYVPVALIFIFAGVIVGVLVFFYPVSLMRFQVKFYELINLRIEPISLQKEFNSSRRAGLYLVVLSILSGIYIRLFLR
jgi:hypothetical protein